MQKDGVYLGIVSRTDTGFSWVESQWEPEHNPEFIGKRLFLPPRRQEGYVSVRQNIRLPRKSRDAPGLRAGATGPQIVVQAPTRERGLEAKSSRSPVVQNRREAEAVPWNLRFHNVGASRR